MRALLRSAPALAAIALGCAGGRAQRPPPYPAASHAVPEPDPACRTLVANAMALNHLERLSVRVALGGDRAAVDLLAPELTPAAAVDVHRAFAECLWAPGTGGETTGDVTFTRR